MTTHDEDTELRRLYAGAGVLTPQMQELREQVGSDPQAARDYIGAVAGLTSIDPFMAGVYGLWLGRMLTTMIQTRAEQDDAFAMEAGTLLVAFVEQMAGQRPTPAPSEAPQPTQIKEAPSA